jgi:hypothetical protein
MLAPLTGVHCKVFASTILISVGASGETLKPKGSKVEVNDLA